MFVTAGGRWEDLSVRIANVTQHDYVDAEQTWDRTEVDATWSATRLKASGALLQLDRC